MNNIFYLIGAHGTGKTTLIKKLEENTSIRVLPRLGVEVDSKEPFVRGSARLVKYFYEHRKHTQLAQENRHAGFIGDRCGYDVLAHANCFVDLKWEKPDQRDCLVEAYRKLWVDSPPPGVILLDPPLDWVREKILDRKKSLDHRWKDSDFLFLKTLLSSYRDFVSTDPYQFKFTALILTETDLEVRAAQAKQWIMAETRFSKNLGI